MPIRSRMTHRAVVERDTSTARDPWGGPVPAPTIIHEAMPCYVQARSESTTSGEGTFLSKATHMMWAPLGTDLAEEDILVRVLNRRGHEVFPNCRRMVGLLTRETHLEGYLEEYS